MVSYYLQGEDLFKEGQEKQNYFSPNILLTFWILSHIHVLKKKA